ncbi:MAG: peptidoglycan-binding protein LysM, partial [Ghiorsea sp.]
TALARQDFIGPDAIEGVGHILDSEDERLNYGANDHVYLSLDDAAKPGDIYNIFRTGDPVYNPSKSKKTPAGYLVNHLGRIEITSIEGGVYRGTIINAFEEIGRTDRLIKAESKDFKIKPDYPKGPLYGHVMYIRNDAAEAGQGQVLGIDLGTKDGLRSGSVLGLYRMGRLIEDTVYQEKTFQALPEEKVGEIIVLAPQENASIVLVTRSSSPVNRGDVVQALSNR